MAEAVAVSDLVAPEHLEIQTEDSQKVADRCDFRTNFFCSAENERCNGIRLFPASGLLSAGGICFLIWQVIGNSGSAEKSYFERSEIRASRLESTNFSDSSAVPGVEFDAEFSYSHTA